MKNLPCTIPKLIEPKKVTRRRGRQTSQKQYVPQLFQSWDYNILGNQGVTHSVKEWVTPGLRGWGHKPVDL